MAELADAVVLGATEQSCRFESCYPQEGKGLLERGSAGLFSYENMGESDCIGAQIVQYCRKLQALLNQGETLMLLRKTNTVDNGQIAAVELDGNVTLKRFRSMGSFVLVIPENDEYEPMMVNQGQFRILGKAIGVIKRSR